jgi:hypothetical protein|nr:MAG TPA: hypothetical protein [Caudoviricetes sp.]
MTIYEKVYEAFFESLLNDYPASTQEKEDFLGIWTTVIKGLTNERFATAPVVFDVLKLTARYVSTLTLNIDNEIEDKLDVFKVRDYLNKDLALKLTDEEMAEGNALIDDLKLKIAQSAESVLGQKTEIPQLRPNLNTPDALFAESYEVARCITQLYENN